MAKQTQSTERGRGLFTTAIKTMLDKRAASDPLFAEAYKREGKSIKECCNCIIKFSVRNTHSKRVATVEFDLKTFKVVQCRGKANSRPKEYDEILKMFKAGATKIQQAQLQ